MADLEVVTRPGSSPEPAVIEPPAAWPPNPTAGAGDEAATRELMEIIALVESPPDGKDLERRLAAIRLPRPRFECLQRVYAEAGRDAVVRSLELTG
jgi:hypothetical protein